MVLNSFYNSRRVPALGLPPPALSFSPLLPWPPRLRGLGTFFCSNSEKRPIYRSFQSNTCFVEVNILLKTKEEENGSRVMSVSRSPRSASFQGASQHLPKLTRGLWGPRPELRSSRRHSLGASWSKSASQF